MAHGDIRASPSRIVRGLAHSVDDVLSEQEKLALRRPARTALPAVFVATSQRPFEEQLMETMAIMDRDMAAAKMGGGADHDFVTMMIPHHQAAIDMAKTQLLYGKDLQMRRLAQEIITDQQLEIELMQGWLKQRESTQPKENQTPAAKTGKENQR